MKNTIFPYKFLKSIFGLYALFIVRPQHVWFPGHLYGPPIPNSSGQLTELVVHIIPPE